MFFMSKYTPLNTYLQNQILEELLLDFKELERILNFQLVHSSRTYSAWWDSSRPHARAWIDAGYNAKADIANNRVRFWRGSSNKVNSKTAQSDSTKNIYSPRFYSKIPVSINAILDAAEKRHEKFTANARFSGPSLYFHTKALNAFPKGAVDFSDASYAMLAAWGMHRMGKNGAKMVEFKEYSESIERHWGQLTALRTLTLSDVNEQTWNVLKELFFGIKAMNGKTFLVANSKVLAHALPELIAPIDRQYTLRFLKGTKSADIPQDIDRQWLIFRKLHESFFHVIARDKNFKIKAANWIRKKTSPWDTSTLKVVDNCIMSGASTS